MVKSSTCKLTASHLSELRVKDFVQPNVHDVQGAHNGRDDKTRRHKPPPHAEHQRAPEQRHVHHETQRNGRRRPKPMKSSVAAVRMAPPNWRMKTSNR